MKRLYKLMILVLIVIVAAGCAKQADPLAYTAEKNGKTVYLMGSIHLADKSFYPLPEKIESAYAKSDALAVEADVTKLDQGAVTKFIFEKGLYPPGKTLKDALGEDFDKFASYCEKNGIQWQQFNSMRPWFANMSVTQAAILKLKLDPTMGIDLHFLNSDENKPVYELESIQAQLEYISSFDEEKQIIILLESLDEETSAEDGMKKLVRLWKSGDENELEKYLFESLGESPEFDAYYELLFDKRNERMTEKIIEILENEDVNKIFVVIGAGHLVGEKGMVSLLRENGFDVNRL